VISETNAVESVSYKKLDDAEDDNQLKKDVNSQSTADIDAAKVTWIPERLQSKKPPKKVQI